jgi:CTD kinase subunit alpha
LALLTYNPAVRLPAQAALDTLPYFARNEPRAEKPAKLLQGLHGEWHEFESRKARREAAAQALHAHVHRENVNEREKRKKEQTKDDEGPPHTGTLTSGQGEQNAGQVDTETGSNPIKESKDDGYVSA